MERKININLVKNLIKRKFNGLKSSLDNAILMKIKQGKKDAFTAYLGCMIRDDEIKLEAIKMFEDDSDKQLIAKTLRSDEKKLEAVKNLDDSVKRAVIEKIKSDEIKLQAIAILAEHEFFDDWIIETFRTVNSDKEKLKLLQYDQIGNRVKLVACSLKIFDYLELDSKDARYLFLNELLNEYYSDDTDKLYTFLTEKIKQIEESKKIKNYEDKIKAIDTIQGDFCKSEIIKTLDDDNEKFSNLYKVKKDESKCNVAINIKDDTLKLKVISTIRDSFCKILAIKSINNINIKIKAFSEIEDNRYYIDFFSNELSSEDKVKAINAVRRGKKEENYIIDNYIYNLKGANQRLEAAMNSLDFRQLGEFINKQKSVYILNENFKRLGSIYNKISEAINSDDDDIKINMIRSINQKYLRLNILNSMRDDDKKIQILKEWNLNRNEAEWYRRYEENASFLIKNIKTLLEMEKVKNPDIKANIMKELYKTNNEVVKNIDFEILDEKYIELLGIEKINLISCYEDIQQKTLELDDRQLFVFSRCIRDVVKQEEKDTWTIYTYEILDNILNEQYKELIYNISREKNLTQEDFNKLRVILQNDNICDIKDMNQVKKFDTIMEEKMERIVNDKNKPLRVKKHAVIQKIFGQDIAYAEKIILKYGESINNIDDNYIKSYIKTLNLIINTTDETKLKEIFNNCKERKIDKGTIELKIKDEYRKLLNEDLYSPTNKDLIEENIYEAGVDFKMIITSVGAYVTSPTMKINYKEDWNRPTIQSQHMCTSYIRNDMIGTAPVHDICYGFNDMQEDSLMLAGNIDIGSCTKTIISESYWQEKYYAPNDLINNTTRHNELCYRRIQKGKKKQPDYIIVFRREGIVKYMEKAKKASKDFGNLPIVIVDIDKCLESEKRKVEQMCREYQRSHNNDLLKEIKQKIRNNRETDPSFGYEFDKIIEKNYISYKKNMDVGKEKNGEEIR